MHRPGTRTRRRGRAGRGESRDAPPRPPPWPWGECSLLESFVAALQVSTASVSRSSNGGTGEEDGAVGHEILTSTVRLVGGTLGCLGIWEQDAGDRRRQRREEDELASAGYRLTASERYCLLARKRPRFLRKLVFLVLFFKGKKFRFFYKKSAVKKWTRNSNGNRVEQYVPPHVVGGIFVARSGIHDAVRGRGGAVVRACTIAADVCVGGSGSVPCDGT